MADSPWQLVWDYRQRGNLWRPLPDELFWSLLHERQLLSTDRFEAMHCSLVTNQTGFDVLRGRRPVELARPRPPEVRGRPLVDVPTRAELVALGYQTFCRGGC